MNRDILRKLLTEASKPKGKAGAPKPAGKKRRRMDKARNRKTKPAAEGSKAGVLSLTSKSPMFKAKKMKFAAQKAVKRHQVVKESAEDLKTNQQLKGSQFRYLNELLYTRSSSEAKAMFDADEAAFLAYHRGFESQRARWPEDPLRRVIRFAKEALPRDAQVADFGCGDARLAAALPDLCVHSFDFVAVNDRVTACDMRKTPLAGGSVDLAVFSLALMGTNCNEFIAEANRVLKKKGVLKIVEITSRIQRITRFVSQIEKMGFRCTEKARTHVKKSEAPADYFSFFTFVKQTACPQGQLPIIVLDPCLYKKR